MALFLLLQGLAFFSNNFLCVSGTVLEFFISQLVLCDSPNKHMNSCFLSVVLSTPSHHPLCCTSAVVPHTPCLLPTLFPQHHVPFHGAFLPTYISFPLLTNYHKLHSLKQHTFMISQFPWVKSWAQLIWALCTRSLKATVRHGVNWAVFSSRGLAGEESTSRFTQVVGRFRYLVATRLKALDFCWLSAEGHSQFWDATCSS